MSCMLTTRGEQENMHNRVLNEFPGTNNNLEGWHTCFSTIIRQTHPSMLEFIDKLKLDTSYSRMLMAQILAGAPSTTTEKGLSQCLCSYRNTGARVQ